LALNPTIDQAIGDSQLRYHSPMRRIAVHDLSRALDGWRVVAIHLRRLPDHILPDHMARQDAETLLSTFPPELRSAPQLGPPIRWTTDPMDLRRHCEGAIRKLPALPTGTPSENRTDSRLAAVPDEAKPLEPTQLLAALWVGSEMLSPHRMARSRALEELDAAVAAVVRGNTAVAGAAA
jgi:hypothetical protein